MKKYFFKSSLVLALLFAAAFTGSAQEQGRFQGNIKGSILGIYWDQHFTMDASFGWRFNDKRYLGLGTGCHLLKNWDDSNPGRSNGLVPAIPLFVDYVRYFPFARHSQNAFFLGLEGSGARYLDRLYLSRTTRSACSRI